MTVDKALETLQDMYDTNDMSHEEMLALDTLRAEIESLKIHLDQAAKGHAADADTISSQATIITNHRAELAKQQAELTQLRKSLTYERKLYDDLKARPR